MNYIELINKFWKSHDENCFSTTEIALYFHLLDICNSCQWKNQFKRRNTKILADLCISYNTLKNARNRLAQFGLISFKSQNGNSNVLYSLSKIDAQDNQPTNEVAAEVQADVKQNKTKTKQKKETVNTSTSGEVAKTWRTDFETYLSQAHQALEALTNDAAFVDERQKYHPNLDIALSLEKAWVDYWSTPAGWNKKKQVRTDTINWKSTFANALNQPSNKVYKQKARNNGHTNATHTQANAASQMRRSQIEQLAAIAIAKVGG